MVFQRLRKTPKFWLEKDDQKLGLDQLFSWLLTPFSWIYLLGFFIKKKLVKTQEISLPVICIGNLNAGGAGKTPCAIAIGSLLQENAVEFCYLTRGYGAEGGKPQFFEKKSLIAGENRQIAKKVGDEAILLNEIAAICVSKNRFLGAKEIVSNTRAQAILLDDGLQNFSLKKDFSILVINSKIGFGNEKILPAGPLRQNLRSGIEPIDLAIIIGKKNPKLIEKIIAVKPELAANRIIFGEVKALNYEKFRGQKILAFCGLAYPTKFFSFLENQGLHLVKTVSFADHHFYTNQQLFDLQNSAKKFEAILLTTKKDWVKFPPDFQKEIPYLDICLEFENKALVTDLLKQKISDFNNY